MKRSSITTLIAVVFLQGCVAGSGVTVQPKDSATAQYDCDNFTVRPDGLFSDGFMVMYYIIPLLPMGNSSDTDSFLEIPITIHSRKDPVYTLALQDVKIVLPAQEEAIYPSKVDITIDNQLPDKPWYYKTSKFTFNVDRHKINEFKLVFTKPIRGCEIPDTPYIRKKEKHYITPVNK